VAVCFVTLLAWAVVTPSALAIAPPNDPFAGAAPIDRIDDAAQTNVLSGDNSEATGEASEPSHFDGSGSAVGVFKSVWYSWTPTYTEDAQIGVCTHFFGPGFDPLLGVYTGSSLGTLASSGQYQPLDCDGDTMETDVTNLFQAQSGTTYHFAVDGNGGSGQYVIVLFQRPPNDDFARAVALSGAQGQSNGDDVFASHETGEPSHGTNAENGSIWYRWTAPTAGKATFTTCGSEGDTQLAVYRGSAVGSLTPVVKNDNGTTCSPQSRVTFTAQKGLVYRIAVDATIDGRSATTLHYNLVQIPQTTITAGPSGLTNDPTPTFKFKSSLAGSAFQCKFDGHAFAPCSGPTGTHTPSAKLADGAHVFSVRATKGGGTDPTPAKRNFTVDSHPPQTTITSGPTGVTHDTTPTFKFSSSESGGSFECMIRLASGGGSFGACSGPGATHTPNLPLANGNYVFSVRARDKAGNADASAPTRSFTVSG
jgi:hypothetical protein